MTITRAGKKLFVANGRSDSVSVIDTATLTTIMAVPVGTLPWRVAVH